MTPERLRPIIDQVRPLADRFGASGYRLYLVGGIVRDIFLRKDDFDDLDFTTDAPPDEIERIVRSADVDAVWTQGKRFGTIGCRIGDVNYEITTHRAEAYSPDSRKPDVVFSTDIEADLSRRDFTINAMALAVPTADDPDPTLIDPFGGLADLAAKRLVTPLSPEESFSDDPLRMLRAARFIARLGLEPDAELLAAVEAMGERMAIVSAERIRDELCKLMVVPDPSAGLWFLADTALADAFFPEFRAMRVEQDPIHHHKDVLAHTIAVIQKTSPNLVVRLSALMHDIGKPKTRAIGPKGVSFHQHEVVGARMTRERMRALKFSNEMVRDVSQLVYLHLRFHGYSDGLWTDAAVRRYVRDAGDLLDELNELTRCDCTTRNKRKADRLARRMDDLEARIDALREQETLDAMRPDLDGNRVIELLGIEPGRVVGEALQMLLEARLEEGPLGEEEAERRLRDWWAQRQG